MGIAGLDTNRLAGLLERKKIVCGVVQGDAAQDHCVLRISSVRRPGLIAIVEYENQGVEPRLASLHLHDDDSAERNSAYSNREKTLQLQGSRQEDCEKLCEWIELEFLSR